MNREQKTVLVEEIAGQIEAAAAVFAVDYRGLSVSQAAELRAKLREAGARFRIVKNSLTKRAADKAGAEELKPLLQGPTALALVEGDAALAARALSDRARVLGILEFKGGLMDGSALTAEEIRSIARLPAREVLNAQLVGTVAAPLTGLVRGCSALISGLAVQLKAIADQGLVGGADAESEAKAEADGEAGADAESEADAKAGADAESEADAKAGADAESEGEAGARAEAEADQAEPEAPETPESEGHEAQSETETETATTQEESG